jgi:hypothetical protein
MVMIVKSDQRVFSARYSGRNRSNLLDHVRAGTTFEGATVALVLRPDGMLPPSAEPHTATLEEIYDLFVAAAPFRERRELVFRGLLLYAELVSQTFSSARLWINGGFTTHKTWAAPNDVDVATIIPVHEYTKAISKESLPLWTMLEVSARQPTLDRVDRIQPLGGLLDSFFVPSIDAHIAAWHATWQRVKGQDGNIIEDATKGFVEVVL